jgi:hypothetical protein
LPGLPYFEQKFLLFWRNTTTADTLLSMNNNTNAGNFINDEDVPFSPFSERIPTSPNPNDEWIESSALHLSPTENLPMDLSGISSTEGTILQFAVGWQTNKSLNSELNNQFQALITVLDNQEVLIKLRYLFPEWNWESKDGGFNTAISFKAAADRLIQLFNLVQSTGNVYDNNITLESKYFLLKFEQLN